jgi:hypothetical protein
MSAENFSTAGLFDTNLERQWKSYTTLFEKLNKLAHQKLGKVMEDRDRAVVTLAPP